MKGKTIECLENNIRKYLFDLGAEKYFLSRTQKYTNNKGKDWHIEL